MIFSVDKSGEKADYLPQKKLASLNVLERDDLEEWVIAESRILGEDLLIITSEYANFEDLRDRLDILALDPRGKLVVVELKRDKADRTTDLQAIKYASYCATLTAREVQEDYREFWGDREGEPLSPEDVGERFVNHLHDSALEDVPYTDDDWANFQLDDRPRILLAAGEFGPEVTSPVMWLTDEYGLDITCTRIDAYALEDRILLNSQQIIPVPEAEEYMTKRREKDEKQRETSVTFTLPELIERDVLREGDIVVFDESKVPEDTDREWDPDDRFWQAEVTGLTGQQNNVRWLHDGETYSFTGLTRELLNQLVGRDKSKPLNGFRYWCHPQFGWRTLLELRKEGVTEMDREEEETVQVNLRR